MALDGNLSDNKKFSFDHETLFSEEKSRPSFLQLYQRGKCVLGGGGTSETMLLLTILFSWETILMTTKAINCTSGDIFLVNKQEIGDRNLYNQTEETEDVESIMFILSCTCCPHFRRLNTWRLQFLSKKKITSCYGWDVMD